MATVQTETIEGFDQACIIQFSCGYWRAKKKIPVEKLARLVEKNPAAAEWLTGTKSLVNPVEVKKVGKVANLAVTYLNPSNPESPVLKHPIAGLKTIPMSLIQVCDDHLSEIKQEFMEAKDKFLANLSEFKAAARIMNFEDGLYDEFDFPLDMEGKYYFEWRFLSMTTPENMQTVAPDVYEREKQKLLETMETVRQESVDALRLTFSDMVKHIVERFSSKVSDGEKKSKTFRNSTVNNFYDFFEQFKQRNIFDDTELNELVEKVQGVLRGKDPDEIRENDSVKKLIRKNMLPLEKQLKELTSKPRRKLDLD